MELNTEINKVFGEEMAKIFAATISEEEIKEKADKIWKDLNKSSDRWGSRSDTALEAEVKRVLLDSLHKRVYEILQEPENKEMFEAKAKEMVAKARQIAEEGIVKQLAENIIGRTISSYNDYSALTTSIMNEIHIRQESTRLY
jgi:hypothetical protein